MRKNYLKLPNFNFEKIKSQSGAAGTIYQWITAIDKYQSIWMEVNPKEKQLRKIEIELEEIEEKLINKRQELFEIKENVVQLKRNLEEMLL